MYLFFFSPALKTKQLRSKRKEKIQREKEGEEVKRFSPKERMKTKIFERRKTQQQSNGLESLECLHVNRMQHFAERSEFFSFLW